jgi:branched-subunit amino acid aminotransferase/4-amino-4-deoxychorismate lyase
VEELQTANEVFLTNSMMELMPVVRLERLAVGDEKPGELTRRLAAAYGALVERECGHA